MRVPGLDERHMPMLVQAIRELATGGSNSVNGPIQLTPGMTVTVVTDSLCTANSHISITPLTATAAIAPWYLSAVGPGSFTITHDNSAATDRNFSYEIRRK